MRFDFGLAVDTVIELYQRYLDDLRIVRAEQSALHANGMRAQLDDIEAELTYLLIREYQPESVVELGALHGWSTTWILRALRDNGRGRLRSFDIVDHARRNVPAELADRWSFVHGDVRDKLDQFPAEINYLFVDASHRASFAKWYLAEVFPRLKHGTPVSVHDVFHYRWPVPISEGSVVVKWLVEQGIEYSTASKAAAPDEYERLTRFRQGIGLTEPIHDGQDNPMIFFSV